MRQLWDEFWATGKVEDYLKYCRKQREDTEQMCDNSSVTNKESNGSVRDSDGHGTDVHVYRGL